MSEMNNKGTSLPCWWSLSFTPMAEYYQQITRLLFAAGCSGIWEPDKSDYRPAIVAYFPAECHDVLTALCRQLSPFLTDPGAFAVEKIGQENWMEGWKDYFRPVNLTENWMVMPPWWPGAGEPAGQILIYPGMAFGTGTHETTRLAATLLEERLEPGNSVLDVGTGSAILAILSRKLGAGQIFAIDVDEDALENAAKNCRLNNCEQTISLSSRSLDDLEEKFDLVVANIIAPVLVKLASQLVEKLHPGGRLILSGILAEQLEMVRKIYEAEGFVIDHQLAEGEWVALRCRP
ncbi:MAG: 50S ribosomal protein L11 methyltransferase [Pseudomonadota bacterium]|nr:50S ribosomal protein L11 methyltransferase [Pseudomonadota bacterium]